MVKRGPRIKCSLVTYKRKGRFPSVHKDNFLMASRQLLDLESNSIRDNQMPSCKEVVSFQGVEGVWTLELLRR